MATATEIGTRALRRIRVVAADETPSAADILAATEALTEIINSWEAQSLSGDALPLDARFEKGIVAMLAVRLCDDFGKSPSPILLQDAMEGEAALGAAFFAVPTQKFENAITYTGAYMNDGFILGQSSGDYAAWAASTDYVLRQNVLNGGNIYECVTAGTSASSGGPTGTSAEITDGTCVWCWRRVDGLR